MNYNLKTINRVYAFLILLFFFSAFLPFVDIHDEWGGSVLGWVFYFDGGWYGWILLIISSFLLHSRKVRKSAIFGIIGVIIFVPSFIFVPFIYDFDYDYFSYAFGYYIGLIIWFLVLGLNLFLLKFWNQQDEFRKSKKKTKVIEEEPVFAQKKRLFGIIKLKKEIDLDETAKFLKISRRDIEGLLYDLAGDNRIQGKFEQNKFIIESDIDNFLNVLDDSFQKWSTTHLKKE